MTDEPPPLCKIHLVPCHCQSQSEKNITQGDSSHRPIYAECRSKQELLCTCVTLQNAIILQTVRLRKALERAQGWTRKQRELLCNEPAYSKQTEGPGLYRCLITLGMPWRTEGHMDATCMF